MSAEHDLDAHLQLKTDEDCLVGTLIVGPKVPVSEISAHTLRVYLEAKGVATRCINEQALADLAKTTKDNPGSEQIAVVANGKPPRHGQARVLVWEGRIADRIEEIAARMADDGPDDEPPIESSDHEDDDNATDHYSHSAYIVVESNEALGTISPPDPGEDGEDIFGEIIPAKQSPNPSYIDTDSLNLTADNQIIARYSGNLIYEGSRRCIERTLDVKYDVGFKTGHITFPGPVNIKGGVKDRFKIEARGDVVVSKLVEAAHIRSARDIEIERGIAGRESATVEAQRDIRAGYLESATVHTLRDCFVQREITNCIVESRGTVNIENGAIRGGHIIAAREVIAGTLGSVQEITTRIDVGSIPELDRPLARIKEMIYRARIVLDKAQIKLDAFRENAHKANPDDIEKSMALEFEVREYQTRLESLEKAAARLRSNLAKNTAARLSVTRRAHHGVTIHMRGHKLSFKDDFDGPFTITIASNGEPMIDHRGTVSPARDLLRVEPDDELDDLRGVSVPLSDQAQIVDAGENLDETANSDKGKAA